jgi:hypothetical protein
VENNWWFCKADFLEYFFRELAPRDEFVLFSHNSDIPVDERFARQLRRRKLRGWFAANVALEHPKLRPLPLGIANPHWPHGNVETLRRVQQASAAKTRLFDVSYAVETNPRERRRCAQETGLAPEPPLPFAPYLERLAASFFSICPRGNGIDTHRVWEALYLRTVPVVTRSALTETHRDLPLFVLDDWGEFSSIRFSPELYADVWGGWDPFELRLDRYLDRVAARPA